MGALACTHAAGRLNARRRSRAQQQAAHVGRPCLLVGVPGVSKSERDKEE